MAASRIKIKALPGRVVRVSPKGKLVPEDEFITVDNTRYVDRLINVWGDVESEPFVSMPDTADTVTATQKTATITSTSTATTTAK